MALPADITTVFKAVFKDICFQGCVQVYLFSMDIDETDSQEFDADVSMSSVVDATVNLKRSGCARTLSLQVILEFKQTYFGLQP